MLNIYGYVYFIAHFILVASTTTTSGCSLSPSSVPISILTKMAIQINDPLLGLIDREFLLYVPTTYQENKGEKPLPLLIFLHGQYGNASDSANNTNFPLIGEKQGFISVFPQGLGDGNSGTGWNTGMMGNGSSTCNLSTKSCCYESCQRLGFCNSDGEPSSKCQWATCYDDVWFLSKLIEHLENKLCLDRYAYFLAGESNGGMMTHWLSANKPSIFRAIVPIYATPLAGGYLKVPNELKNVRIMALHDRNDTIIPSKGGNAEGWFFESEETTLNRWASLHECDEIIGLRPLNTPFGKSDKNLACFSYSSCNGREPHDEYGRHSVVYCEYDGNHGDSFSLMYDMIWWFFEYDSEKKIVPL